MTVSAPEVLRDQVRVTPWSIVIPFQTALTPYTDSQGNQLRLNRLHSFGGFFLNYNFTLRIGKRIIGMCFFNKQIYTLTENMSETDKLHSCKELFVGLLYTASVYTSEVNTSKKESPHLYEGS